MKKVIVLFILVVFLSGCVGFKPNNKDDLMQGEEHENKHWQSSLK